MTEAKTDQRAWRSGRWFEIGLTLLILGAILVFLTATFGKTSAFAQASSGRGPYFFPRIVLVGLLVAVVLLFGRLRHHSRPLPPARPTVRMLVLIGATAAYCALIGFVGFLIASVLFCFVVPLLLGRRDLVVLAVISLAYGAAVWLLFEKVFLIILPASPWPLGF